MVDGGGLQVWSKEQGLGPCRVGVRGFKSHPPHFQHDFVMTLKVKTKYCFEDSVAVGRIVSWMKRGSGSP